MATVFERIRDITAEKLSVDPATIKPESSFTDDLNADSLDVVELIMALEEEFSTDEKQLEISDEEAEGLRTVADVDKFLKTKGISDE
ncbi:MAG: acyl carrier protein [Chloroflexi bacterium]|nr:acyl carrier protein [Chloroflexota bacterium]